MLPFLDLKPQYELIQSQVNAGIQRVLEHGRYVMGPEIDELEKKLADKVGAKHAICVSSGTTALLCSLIALGVQPGDEVIVPDFTFFAPAEVILLLGAKPVLVDVEPHTYNLDPNKLASAITDSTKAIIAVSLYGQCADFDSINEIAAAHNLPVIEDAAQSFGAQQNNKYSGNLSTIGCTSFFPSKPLGCYGDGGACFTDDDDIAKKLRAIRQHGEVERYDHAILGVTGRMSSIQAAVLLAKLPIFDDEMNKRRQVAAWYDAQFKGNISIPKIESKNISVYAQYTIEIDDRDQVKQSLSDKGIPSAIHYPKPIHQQSLYVERCGNEAICPVALAASQRVLSLPFGPYMSEAQVQMVCAALL